MNRSSFVVLYTKKEGNNTLYCLSCFYERKEREQIHGICNCDGHSGIWSCANELFDNTKHIPIVTRNKCTIQQNTMDFCQRCVLNKRYKIR